MHETAHWEAQRGSNKQAADYCKKDGDFFEWGEMPLEKGIGGGDPSVALWDRTLEAVRLGRISDVPSQMTHHIKACEYRVLKERLQAATCVILDGQLEHEWHYGPSGTGKTSSVMKDYPNCYVKDPKERWWDCYAGQDVVLIDDFDKYQVSMAGDLKRWLDRYPFMAPVKGGYLTIRPKKIIITSNYHYDDIWEDQVTRECIKRRVQLVPYSSNLISVTFNLPK